jgi:excisionase family DNA binding protein
VFSLLLTDAGDNAMNPTNVNEANTREFYDNRGNVQKSRFRMLTIKEAAECFHGLTAFRIRELIKSGELPHLNAGKKFLVCEQAIENYIFKNAVECGILDNKDGCSKPLTSQRKG